jgi:hypothetical protein
LKTLFSSFLICLFAPGSALASVECSDLPAIVWRSSKYSDLWKRVNPLYKVSALASSRENHRHVLRMIERAVGSVSELEDLGIRADAFVLGILISDVGKEPEFVERFKSRYAGNRFAAFLDHSKLSIEVVDPIRREVGLGDLEWKEISDVVVGHNGPASPGSWWKENYERELKTPYEPILSLSGLLHAYLDRLDQGGLFRTSSALMAGGLIKISYELSERVGDQKELLKRIRPTLEAIHRQTETQLKDLERNVGPKFLGKRPLPPFIRKQVEEFQATQNHLRRILSPSAGSEFPRVLMENGTTEVVTSLDQLWKRLSETKK